MKRKMPLTLLLIAILLALAACSQIEMTDIIRSEPGQSEAGAVAATSPTTAKTRGKNVKLPAAGLSPVAQISSKTMPCPMNLPAGEVEGETAVCGQITVPENWENPGERTIDITYAILKAQSLSPFAEPVLYLEGGPGGSALEDIEKLSGVLAKLRATRDVIYYDQRGTDYSANLECPLKVRFGSLVKTEEAGGEETPAEQDAADGDAEAETDAETDAESDAEAEFMAALAAAQSIYKRDPEEVLQEKRAEENSSERDCAEYFTEQGIDLTQYTTAASVRDLTALMNALEYDAYNVYGISYGSRLGLELMRAYEEEDSGIPQIRSVVLDGLDPPHVDNVTRTPFVNMYIVLDALALCEADEVCAAAYPDISQRAVDLLDQVEDEALQIASSDGMTDTVTLDQLTTLMGGNAATIIEDSTAIPSPMVVPYLPRLVDELSRGVADVYTGLHTGTLPPAKESEPAPARSQLDPLAVRTEQIAAETGALSDELQALSAQMQRASQAQAEGDRLPQQFVNELVYLVNEKPSFGESGQLAELAYIYLATNEPSRDLLSQAVGFFKVENKDVPFLKTLIGMMTDAEIQDAVELLLSDRVKEQLTTAVQFQMNNVVLCNDLYHGFDIGDAFDAYRNAEAPQLLGDISLYVNYIVRCEHYGLTEGEGESPEPVTSSLPTLIVNGSVDKNTAARWGESTFEHLPNAQMVTVPLVAHGASALSVCGQDITNAFFTYPGQEVNDACTEALQPVFVLPDDDLGLNISDGS